MIRFHFAFIYSSVMSKFKKGEGLVVDGVWIYRSWTTRQKPKNLNANAAFCWFLMRALLY